MGSVDLGVITTLGSNAGLVMDFLGVVLVLGSVAAVVLVLGGIAAIALVLGGIAAVALVLGGVAFDLIDDAGEDKRPGGTRGSDEVCDDFCDDSAVT